jgi:hypothetical protein
VLFKALKIYEKKKKNGVNEHKKNWQASGRLAPQTSRSVLHSSLPKYIPSAYAESKHLISWELFRWGGISLNKT